MIDLHDVLIAVLTSGVTVGAAAFVLKRIVDRAIDHRFRMRELAAEAELDTISSARTALFEKELLVYPEILEVVYRSRNAARECSDPAKRSRAVLNEFHACKIHLVENLYKYRLFIPNPQFRQLHRFKTELQEFAVLLDEVTRSSQVEDAPVDTQVREVADRQLRERFAEIDRHYGFLSRELQDIVRSKLGQG